MDRVALDDDELEEILFFASRDTPSDTPLSSAPPGAIFLRTMVEPKEYFFIESVISCASIVVLTQVSHEDSRDEYRKYRT